MQFTMDYINLLDRLVEYCMYLHEKVKNIFHQTDHSHICFLVKLHCQLGRHPHISDILTLPLKSKCTNFKIMTSKCLKAQCFATSLHN